MATRISGLIFAVGLGVTLTCQAEDIYFQETSQPVQEQMQPTPVEQPMNHLVTSATASPEQTQLDKTDTSEKPGFWQRQWNTVTETYHAPDSELYIPLYTWHNRATYDHDKIKEYNENPWGIGYGKYRYDEDGDWHAVYAMIFMDSHDDPEPIIGYAFEKIWRPSKNWRFGAGFTLGITMRSDFDYIPIPAPLPLLSVGYRQLTLETTYIPGGKNNGNVLFTWLRWQL